MSIPDTHYLLASYPRLMQQIKGENPSPTKDVIQASATKELRGWGRMGKEDLERNGGGMGGSEGGGLDR